MGCPRTSCGCRKKKLQADKFAGCTILNKMASHADSRRAYERLLASGNHLAERTYYSGESGGFVVVHRGHMTGGLDSEMETARFYANDMPREAHLMLHGQVLYAAVRGDLTKGEADRLEAS